MKAKTKNSAIKVLVTTSLTPGIGVERSCLLRGEPLVIGDPKGLSSAES